MIGYSEVLEILERAVGGKNIHAHGNFWRGKTRDQFVALKPFGYQLIAIGDSTNSNIIKALKGEPPFGKNIEPMLSGKIFRRMPAGMDAVADSDIKEIGDWINAGCPETLPKAEFKTASKSFNPIAPQALSDARINAFFREFDDYFMYASSGSTDQIVGNFMAIAPLWPGFGFSKEVDWVAALTPAVVGSVVGVSTAQLDIFRRHFGDPIDMGDVSRAFVRFGSGTLAPDSLRPQDPMHQMNGYNMWNFWLAFAGACIGQNIERQIWTELAKRVTVGLVHDSLYRTDRKPNEKLLIKRYAAGTAALENKIISDLSGLTDTELQLALVDISVESLTPAAPLVV